MRLWQDGERSSPGPVSRRIRDCVDWDAFFDLVQNLPPSLNSRKNRWDKSDLIEAGLDRFSDGQLKWVDDDGFDHIMPDGTKIEFKFEAESLRTKKRRDRKRNGTIAPVRLMNSMSGGKARRLDKKFDFLIVCDLDEIVLLPFATVSEYQFPKNDVIEMKDCPVDRTEVLCHRPIRKRSDVAQFYLTKKRELQFRFIEQFAPANQTVSKSDGEG